MSFHVSPPVDVIHAKVDGYPSTHGSHTIKLRRAQHPFSIGSTKMYLPCIVVVSFVAAAADDPLGRPLSFTRRKIKIRERQQPRLRFPSGNAGGLLGNALRSTRFQPTRLPLLPDFQELVSQS
jgi:hypothetical protein